MAIISTDQELFVFDNKAGYTGQNYVSADNANQLIGLTPDAISAIESVSGIKTNVDYLVDCCSGVQSAINVLSADVSGKMDESLFSYNTENLITAYNNSAFAGQGGGGAEYFAGKNIDITNNVISLQDDISLSSVAVGDTTTSNSVLITSGGKIQAGGLDSAGHVSIASGGLTAYMTSETFPGPVNVIGPQSISIYVSGGAAPSANITFQDVYADYRQTGGQLYSLTGIGNQVQAQNNVLFGLSGQVSALPGQVETLSGYITHLTNTKQDKLTNDQLSAISSVSGKQDKLTNAQLSAISSVSSISSTVTGKQDKLTNAQLSAISSVSGKQNALTNAQLSAISSVSGMYNMITAMSAMLSAQWQLSAGNGIAITNNTSTKTSVISLA